MTRDFPSYNYWDGLKYMYVAIFTYTHVYSTRIQPHMLMWAVSSALRRRATVAPLLSRGFSEASNSKEVFPNTFIHSSAEIGTGCNIGAFTTVGQDVVIGADTTIGANVTLQNCTIGSNVVVHPGVRIGQDGFGFMLDASGDHAKKPQELRVEVHDHVEIGANSSIDRGSWRNTIIGKGCKLDNLIQIGHNVQLGTGCVIAAQTGIAGSTTLGNNVYIGGQVGIAQHLKIGDNVRIAAKSGVMNNLESNATYGGSPAVPIMEYRRQMAHLRRQGKKPVD